MSYDPHVLSITTHIDPQRGYPHLAFPDILATLGVLPKWAREFVYAREDAPHLTFRKFLDMVYPHGGGGTSSHIEYLNSSNIHPETLIFSFPEDPDIFPLLVMEIGIEEKFIFYPYAIVAHVTSPETANFYRLD